MEKNSNKLGKKKRDDFLASMDPQGGAMVAGSIVEQHLSFQGPIPPPGILAEYEKICPGLATRIVSMAEAQSAHRQELEKVSVTGITTDAVASRQERRWGQVIGGIVVTTAICGAVALGIWGRSAWANAAGGTIGSISLVGVIIAFMTGKANGKEKQK